MLLMVHNRFYMTWRDLCVDSTPKTLCPYFEMGRLNLNILPHRVALDISIVITGGVDTLRETVKSHVVVTPWWIQIRSQREDLNKLEGQKVINSKWIDLSYWPYIVQAIPLSRDCCIKVYRCNYFSSQSYKIL